MTHNIITLQHERFYTRTILGKTLLNIRGETYEVEVKVTGPKQQYFEVRNKETGDLLCDFCSWHMHGGPDMYQIEIASPNQAAGDATLIVLPTLKQWEAEHCDEDD